MSILDLTARGLEVSQKIQNCKSPKDSSKSSKTLKVRHSSGNLKNFGDKFLREGAENPIGAERFRPREPAERAGRSPNSSAPVPVREHGAPGATGESGSGAPCLHGAVSLIRGVGSTNPRTRPTYEASTTRGYLRTPRSYNRFDVTPDPVNALRDAHRAGTLSELDIRN